MPYQGFSEAGKNGNLVFISTSVKDPKNLGRKIAELEFDIMGLEENALFINWMWSHPLYRQQGLNSILLREVLQDHPQVQRIVAYLTDTNLEIYRNAFLKCKNANQALKATPFYKTLKSLGFPRIEVNEDETTEIVVNLGRP